MTKVKKTEVLITGALHESALQAFRCNTSLSVNYKPDSDRTLLMGMVAQCHVLVTRSETNVDRELIDAAPSLKVIARAAVGVGNIDISYASERGILVINCPGKNTNSAAELSIGLLIGMLRNIPQAHANVKSGKWDRHKFAGRELKGKRLGIVGLGNVGHRMAKFAHGFDMDVSAYDPYISPTIFEKNSVKRVTSLKELASQSDVLSVHVPLNKETKGMISKSIISAMPKGSWIVNAARGGIFLEEEIRPFLESGHIAGLAVDTFEVEPEFNKSLVALSNVWVTPHIGASTEEAQIAIGEAIYLQVVKAIEGGVVDYPVNLPNVGIISDERIKAFAILSEKLGSLAGQIIEFNPSKIEMLYRGELAGLNHSLVRLSFMKGYASRVMNDFVSFVNVEAHFLRLGLKVEDKEEPSFDSYRSALKIRISGPNGEVLTVGGIVFDDLLPRLSLINGFHFEVEPSGNLVLVQNEDKPGVIGDLGHFLGLKGVNIATFELSRNRRGGKAMSVIKTDQELSMADLEEMKRIPNLIQIQRVFL